MRPQKDGLKNGEEGTATLLLSDLFLLRFAGLNRRDKVYSSRRGGPSWRLSTDPMEKSKDAMAFFPVAGDVLSPWLPWTWGKPETSPGDS